MLKRLSLVFLGLVLVVFAAACGGGGGNVPADAVAVVDGTEISRAELDELVERAKKGYAARKLEFPKVGTPEYQQLRTRSVAFLVQLEEWEREADALGIKVTENEVDRLVQEFVKTKGSRQAAEKDLAEQGLTFEGYKDTVRISILTQKLFELVTKDVKVEDAEILAYYQQNLQTQYQTPESREVRHILIAEKQEGDEVDFAASKAEADRIYAALVNGGDFGALAKEHSDDTTSAVSGGKLPAPIRRGETVPEFDKVAFELKKGVISKPVKTTYGYHIIEALSPVTEAKTTPLAEVRSNIRLTLLQEKKNAFITDWVEDLPKKYEGKVSYAAGFEPPDIPDETTTETDPS